MSWIPGRDAIGDPLRFRGPVGGGEREAVVRTRVNGVHLQTPHT